MKGKGKGNGKGKTVSEDAQKKLDITPSKSDMSCKCFSTTLIGMATMLRGRRTFSTTCMSFFTSWVHQLQHD